MQQARVALTVAVLAISILMAPAGGDAQQPAKVPRSGYLSADASAPASHLVEACRQGLRELATWKDKA